MTEEPIKPDEGEPVTNGRISMANSLLTVLTGLIAIAAGMGVSEWTVHPLFIPLSFVWCFVYALRVADAYVQKGS